jgi:hypothetical protein
MNIDRTHLSWLVGTLIAAAWATLAHLAWPAGSIAGRRLDVVLGICGTLMMAFAGLLPFRKRVKHANWPIFSLQTWLKGHIWVAWLATLLILLHARFRRGGVLSTALLGVLGVVVLSGLLGLLFQHLLPLVKAGKEGKAATAARIITHGRRANLFLHVPLSATLFVLIVVHAWASMYF